MDREADRDWYDQDEGGDYVDELNADKYTNYITLGTSWETKISLPV